MRLSARRSPNSIGLDVGVPARGWTGEAYQGHIFWDELFIFPFLNYRMPEITRSLLMYRYRRLDEARAQARFPRHGAPVEQFEAGREEVGKGGVVRDPAVHQRVCAEAAAWVEGQGWTVLGASRVFRTAALITVAVSAPAASACSDIARMQPRYLCNFGGDSGDR